MKVLDIAIKDLTHSFRSLFAVGMMVAAPLLLTGLIYLAFGGGSGGQAEIAPVQVGLVNLDRPPEDAPVDIGASIVEMFNDSSVEGWLEASAYASGTEARAAVDRQEIGVAVLVPEGLSRAILEGQAPPPVVILQDPTLTIGPQVVKDMLLSLLEGVAGGGVAYETLNSRLEAHGLSPHPAGIPALLSGYSDWYVAFQRALFHDPEKAALRLQSPSAGEGGTGQFQQLIGLTMAGQMIFFAFFTGAFSMTSVINEQEAGTLARLFTTPTGRSAILAGKLLAVVLLVLIQGLVLVVLGRLLFGVDWGRPGGVALAMAGQTAAASGLGALLISSLKSSRQVGPVIGGVMTVLGMLGGLFTVAIPNLPPLFERISVFTPHQWVIRTWMLAMEGAGAAELLAPFGVAFAFGLAAFALGAVLFNRRFA